MITVVVQRLVSLLRLATCLVLVAGLTLAVFAGGGCSPRALLELDVTGDSAFQSVKLRLTAGGTSKDFPNASFDATMSYKAGLYVDSSGSVNVVANVLDGSGKCIGAGTASLSGIATGTASGATPLMVVHTTACSSVTPGTGGSGNGSGGATGAGGGGNGSGGSPGGTGGSGNGSGGSSSGMGGSGNGSGGSPGGTNLIMNGDFSNGSTSWGIPAMVGTVNQSVTNGQFCVSVVGTATIGYPSGGTAPFQITGGTPYTFSYQASSTGNLTIEAKVGQIQTPYDATGSDWMNEPVLSSLQPFTHTFTRGSTDSMMGIAFNLSGGPGMFCLDNVSLTAN
jgi:hypothetical protein